MELAAIPLYLLTKPHLDVCTDDEEAEQWLALCLLLNLNEELDVNESSAHLPRPWWVGGAPQSDRGILLEVRDGSSESGSTDAVDTEFLIYATVQKSPQLPRYLPSPPASSSPQRADNSDEGNHDGQTKKIRFYAVPLASTFHQLQNFHQKNQSTINDHLHDGEAFFLPQVPSNEAAFPDSPPKRRRLLTLFEDATHQRKRLSRRGGEGVAKAMAVLHGPTLDIGIRRGDQPDASKPDSPGYLNVQGQSGARGTSRATALSSIRDTQPSRPLPRSQECTDGKRSFLHAAGFPNSLKHSNFLQGERNNFEDQNRSTLTRIIMAGMRMYGLQQRRKSVSAQARSELGTDSPCNDLGVPGGGDEYKMVYHHTLKAASFTFRSQMDKEIINQGAMGDVVDQLLALFCADQSSNHNTADSFSPGRNMKESS